MAENIFSSSFFNLPHPLSPWTSIQFRTSISSAVKLSDVSHWEEITQNPSNFFDSMTIEDNGGFQKLTLKLFDKNFGKIENIITKSIIAARDSGLVKEGTNITDKDTKYFEFKIDNHAQINLRIRFGYSITPSTDFFDETEWEKYAERINETRPVIRSPWIYFQMMGTNFQLTPAGLAVTISAFSTTDSFLSRARLVKKYARMVGTPKKIITSLSAILEEVSNKSLSLTIRPGNDPEPIENDDGNNKIEIHMGGSPNVDNTGTRSMRRILNEICAKVPPKTFDKEDNPSTTHEKYVNPEGTNINKVVPYTYMFIQKEEGGGTVEFYYPEARKSPSKMRNYIWREHGLSIVADLSINSQIDFASLNSQILVKNADEISLHATKRSKDDEYVRQIEPANVTKALNDMKVTFVSNVVSSDNRDNLSDTKLLVEQVVANLNQGVFDGTLTLPGDPFFLFDKELRPFEYKIKIIIMRPSFIDFDGTVVQEEQSYLTGEYVVKNISHQIDNSGFRTVLNIQRWPVPVT